MRPLLMTVPSLPQVREVRTGVAVRTRTTRSASLCLRRTARVLDLYIFCYPPSLNCISFLAAAGVHCVLHAFLPCMHFSLRNIWQSLFFDSPLIAQISCFAQSMRRSCACLARPNPRSPVSHFILPCRPVKGCLSSCPSKDFFLEPLGTKRAVNARQRTPRGAVHRWHQAAVPHPWKDAQEGISSYCDPAPNGGRL